MSTIQSLELFLISLGTFLALDSIWLGIIAPKLYKHFIGHLMAAKPNLISAIIFYVLFVIGLLIFVLVPALNKHDLEYAIGYGALFGFFTYATFDLTSQSVFKKWPTAITVIDMAWGVVLSTVASLVAYSIAHTFIH